MQEPKKPDPNDTAKRRAMPPPPPQRPPLRGAPGSGPPRPPAPKPAAPAGGDLDAAPPPPASESDDDLVFMTHAPGATVMPRQVSEADKEVEEFRERLRARQQADKEKAEAEKEKAEKERLRKGTAPRSRPTGAERVPALREPREAAPTPLKERPSTQAPAAARDVTDASRGGMGSRFVEGAGRLSEAAGVGAIQRTLQASRGVQATAPAAGAPSFWGSIPGALVAPLRRGSIGAAVGATLLLALALLAVEVSPPVGLLACAAIGLELAALLVKHVRDSGGGRDAALWPTFAEVAGGSMAWLAAGIVLLPAIVVAAAVVGGAAWDMSNPGSAPARAGRVWSPPAEVAPAALDEDLPGGEVRVPDALGRHALAMLDAAVGPARARGAGDARSARELATSVAAATRTRVQALAPAPETGPLSLAWRGLLAVGLLLYPIALIACARLKSAYAPLLLPMLLRAVLRAPAAYVVVVLGWLAHLGLLLGALLLLPEALHEKLAPAQAHLAWVTAVAFVGGPGSLVTASLLGRFYRSQAHRLGWE